MKNKYILGLLLTLFIGCTSEFKEYKNDNDLLTSADVSAKYFFTNTLVNLYFPATWDYIYIRYLYATMYGGYAHMCNKDSWGETDALFDSNDGWTSSAGAWNAYSLYFANLDLFTKAVEPGGEFENPLMEAVAIILKSTYFAMYSDVWGELPYSEVGIEGVLNPKFDTQKEIYEGVIADLDRAMATIGDNTVTGIGVFGLGEYDIMFGGDLQKWKAFANGLKLRQALRAKGAPGADFADAAITQALSAPLPTTDAKIVKDLSTDSYGTEGYFLRYGDLTVRVLSNHLINALQDNNDPRLPAYAEKVPGGIVKFVNYTIPQNKKLVDYLLTTLVRAGVIYTSNLVGDDLEIEIEENKFYAGQVARFNNAMKPFLDLKLFSRYNINIEGFFDLGTENDNYVMPMAEIYLLQAEAAVLGFGGDANSLYQAGIQASFEQWGVSDNGYLSSSIATLSGTKEEKLQQIGLQLWLATNQVDLQGWAYARDFKLEGITDDIPNDPDIYSTLIPLGLGFPQRLKYGAASYSLNLVNTEAAVARQGVDDVMTPLWFTKGTK